MSADLDKSLKRWARQETTMDTLGLIVAVTLIFAFLGAIVWRVYK